MCNPQPHRTCTSRAHAYTCARVRACTHGLNTGCAVTLCLQTTRLLPPPLWKLLQPGLQTFLRSPRPPVSKPLDVCSCLLCTRPRCDVVHATKPLGGKRVELHCVCHCLLRRPAAALLIPDPRPCRTAVPKCCRKSILPLSMSNLHFSYNTRGSDARALSCGLRTRHSARGAVRHPACR